MPSPSRSFAVHPLVNVAVAVGIAVLLPSLVIPSADAPSVPTHIVRTGTITEFDRSRVIELPFQVPPGTQRLDIEFSPEPSQPEAVRQFDLGLRSPEGLRGWSEDHHGAIHLDAVSASYGYLPGPIVAGEWTVLIGVAHVPPEPTPYALTIRMGNEDPRRHLGKTDRPGWYAGDLHTHSGHSDGRRRAGDVPVTVEDVTRAAERNRLDFVAVTDHNTFSHWLDIDRLQTSERHLLLLHGREVTTYHGHFNAIGERRAKLFEFDLSRPIRDLMHNASADGAFVSINHPWLSDDEWCPGCAWSGNDEATLAQAHAMEIANGPTRDELPGWRRWAELLNRGYRLVPVGGSDTHDVTASNRHVGEPTTVVYAESLSEEALVAGLKSGRVYGRTEGHDGPRLDLVAERDGQHVALMGQSIRPGFVQLSATIEGAADEMCTWFRRGLAIADMPIRAEHATLTIDLSLEPGDWVSILVRRGSRVTGWSNAIYVER